MNGAGHFGGYVYIMANKPNGTVYIGVTSNLVKRVWEHRTGVIEGFTTRYDLKMLVWYQAHERIEEAIATEKRMKEWRRSWMINAIVSMNPEWRDLWPDITA